MAPASRTKVLGPAAILVLFAGLWLGHSLEYLRVWGTNGFPDALLGPVHGYMAPLGLLLLVATGRLGARWLRLWLSLGRRLDQARHHLAQLWRGRGPQLPARAPVAAAPSAGSRFAVSWLILCVAQICLYIGQENLEAIRVGYPAPGLGAVSGVHWAAPLIHAGVAFVATALVTIALRLFRVRTRAVDVCERLARVLLRALLRPSSTAVPAASWIPAPRERFGLQLLRRPPPAPLLDLRLA